MADVPRYRVENGEAILDVQVATVDQLFDNRDPAPFRRRDLDPGLMEYLTGAAHDLARAERIRLVIWIGEACSPAEVERGVQAHFEYELERVVRRRREQVRSGWIGLAIAVVAVIVLSGLARVVTQVVPGNLGAGLGEAIVISGWVLMWRPAELLVYDGIPWRRERRALSALRHAALEIRAGARP